MRVLVTGGAGYIGSHTVLALIEAGHEPIIIDTLDNADQSVIGRLESLAGKPITFHKADCGDTEVLGAILQQSPCEALIHFAGLKAVGESVAEPLRYYERNVGVSIRMIRTAIDQGVKHIVFSSTATVYGEASAEPIPETAPLHPKSPYAWSKLMIEQILRDTAVADPSLHISLLRYFNPIGAHGSGLIGEDPHGIPNNLLPYVAQVASGERPVVNVFGDDYDTPDGTGVRDYLHVLDLAAGHVKALQYDKPGVGTYNLGTGAGTSVLEMITAFEKAAGVPIPYVVQPRRAGDISQFFSDPSKATRELHWQASHTIDDMCADTWRWQNTNQDLKRT